MGLMSSHHSRVIFWRPAARIDRNGGRARLARPADKDSLHRIACRLVCGAGTPANRWLVEAPTLPPVGIAASCVHGAFHRARKRLPALICGDKKPLATPHARCMKSDLLGIWTIVRKLVLGRTLRLHRLKPRYGGLDLLRRQAVNVEVQAHCQPHQRRAMRAAPVLCAPRSCADAAPGEARRSVRRPGPT